MKRTNWKPQAAFFVLAAAILLPVYAVYDAPETQQASISAERTTAQCWKIPDSDPSGACWEVRCTQTLESGQIIEAGCLLCETEADTAWEVIPDTVYAACVTAGYDWEIAYVHADIQGVPRSPRVELRTRGRIQPAEPGHADENRSPSVSLCWNVDIR